MENNPKLKSPYAILFVDDEEKLRKYFAMAIQRDFEVLCAANVEEAKKVLEENHERIGVVLTDQRMPGGNGVVLLKHLKDNYPAIIRLLTTAYSDLTDAIDAINKGEIIRYIQKPWDFTVLANELSSAMELFELRKQCDALMAEKFSIKKKTEKLNRVKLLMSLSGVFDELKNANRSIAGYVQNFVILDRKVESIDDDFMRSSDMGGKDVEEVKALSNMVSNIVTKIGSASNLDKFEDLDLKNLILELSDKAGIKVDFDGALNSNFNGNLDSLSIAFESLFAFLGAKSEVRFEVEENSELLIKAKFVGFEHSVDFLDNNALSFCLFAGHNGFELLEFSEVGFSLRLPGMDFDDEDLDNLILSSIL